MLRRINCHVSRIGAVFMLFLLPFFFTSSADAGVGEHPAAQMTKAACSDTAIDSVDQARVVAACEATSKRARRVSLSYRVVVPADACREISSAVVDCNTIAYVKRREYHARIRVTGDKIGSLSTKVTRWHRVKVRMSSPPY